MIRKPSVDWQRESRAVAALDTAAHVARGGARAVQTGGHVARGLFCYGFALLWGFAALAGGLVGGSMPTLIGVGAMAWFMMWSGNRAFRKARSLGK